MATNGIGILLLLYSGGTPIEDEYVEETSKIAHFSAHPYHPRPTMPVFYGEHQLPYQSVLYAGPSPPTAITRRAVDSAIEHIGDGFLANTVGVCITNFSGGAVIAQIVTQPIVDVDFLNFGITSAAYSRLKQ